jgi:sec-independent protein translocase protein TatA
MNILTIICGIIGPTELIVILVVVLMLFGGKKIPELMHGIGKGVKEFKNAANETEEIKKEINETSSDKKSNPTS